MHVSYCFNKAFALLQSEQYIKIQYYKPFKADRLQQQCSSKFGACKINYRSFK